LALKLKDLSYGRDSSTVKASGKPKSIGLEDSCKSISIRCDVEQKFRLLLARLIQQISEDDRIPVCIKLTLRKYDPANKTSHRKTKQCNILPSLFKNLNLGGNIAWNSCNVAIGFKLLQSTIHFINTHVGLCRFLWEPQHSYTNHGIAPESRNKTSLALKSTHAAGFANNQANGRTEASSRDTQTCIGHQQQEKFGIFRASQTFATKMNSKQILWLHQQ
jgi:hypothetical protein